MNVETITEKSEFTGVWMPKEIWLSKALSPIQKLFLLEIDNLDNEKGCYASNAHFSALFGLSKSRCSQIINSLADLGWLNVSLIYQGFMIKCRIIKVINKLTTPIKNSKQPIKYTKPPCQINAKGINNSLNNDKNKDNNNNNNNNNNNSKNEKTVVCCVDDEEEKLSQKQAIVKPIADDLAQCMEWAKTIAYWTSLALDVERFTKVYNKPNSALKKQFDEFRLLNKKPTPPQPKPYKVPTDRGDNLTHFTAIYKKGGKDILRFIPEQYHQKILASEQVGSEELKQKQKQKQNKKNIIQSLRAAIYA